MHIRKIVHPFSRTEIGLNTELPQHLYLDFLTPNDFMPLGADLVAGGRACSNFISIEIKGKSPYPVSFDLLDTSNTYWLLVQLKGKSHLLIDGENVTIDSKQYFGRHALGNKSSCIVESGDAWCLLLGLPNLSRKEYQEEWAIEMESLGSENVSLKDVRIQPIAPEYIQLLKGFAEIDGGNYSFPVRLHTHILTLVDQYHLDVESKMHTAADNDDIALYHQALQYIDQHYAEKDLSRKSISDALNTSLSSLHRAFSDKDQTIMEVINLARLHRAKELLRTTDQTIEEIAYLVGFSSNSHLSRLYTQFFSHSPSEERRKHKKRDFEKTLHFTESNILTNSKSTL